MADSGFEVRFVRKDGAEAWARVPALGDLKELLAGWMPVHGLNTPTLAPQVSTPRRREKRRKERGGVADALRLIFEAGADGIAGEVLAERLSMKDARGLGMLGLNAKTMLHLKNDDELRQFIIRDRNDQGTRIWKPGPRIPEALRILGVKVNGIPVAGAS